MFRLNLWLNVCQLCNYMTKITGYSIGNAQIDNGTKEKLKFRICPSSTVSLLASRSHMSNMLCFAIGGMKNSMMPVFVSFNWGELSRYDYRSNLTKNRSYLIYNCEKLQLTSRNFSPKWWPQEPFGTTEKIIISPTRLPSTIYSVLSFSFPYS